uniref:RNA-directed DNA polymerase homolog n=1 Tax=Nicotiana tabacum TaxID=4097 RepID=A0A1S4CA12_TOBAC
MDLSKGYYQVRIAEGDEPKTTCVTHYGAFEWLVMPFGLTNALATFCTLMNKLFHPFLDQFVVIYLDDIVIYSSCMEEHLEHLRKVFQILRENDLFVKREKCSFAQSQVQFLGHTISQGQIRMDSNK